MLQILRSMITYSSRTIKLLKQLMSWKAHQLRSIQQDNAQLELLENLDESSVLGTEDCAMKFFAKKI